MSVVHPIDRAVYERDDDGSVRVTTAEGRQGWFDADGTHLRGEVRSADPHVLDWVGGPQAKKRTGRLRATAD